MFCNECNFQNNGTYECSMMLNFFLKWTRLLSLSTLFINDLHIWIFIRIAWSPWAFQNSDHVDCIMNTTEKSRIQKLVQKLLSLIFCLALYFYISFEDLTKRSTWFCPRVLSCPKRTCYSVSKTKAQFWERDFYLEKPFCHWPILSKKMGMSLSKWVYIYFLGCAALRAASIYHTICLPL